MPNLSPTMEFGSIAKWNLKEGDSFSAGDVFCEVETDKATVDFESQDEGTIARILAEAGPGDIKCGEPIMILVEDAADVDAFKDYAVSTNDASLPEEDEVAPPTSTAVAPPPPPPPPPTLHAAPSPPHAAPPTSVGDRLVASPLAHKLAKELGHDVSLISGTGPGGRVIADDVREYVPAATTAEAVASAAPMIEAAAAPIPGAGFIDYPTTADAREISARLAASKTKVPHYYLTVDVEVDAVLALRDRLNASVAPDVDDDAYAGVSLHDMLVKAAASACRTVPAVNASWLDSVVRVYDEVDVNVAVGSGDGLRTPVIRNVGAKGLGALSRETAALVAAVDAEEEIPCRPGTITVINLGMYGVKSCAPIITEPQACALALGAAETRIVPSDDPETPYREAVVLTATVSLDHRVVDGAVGAQWLSAFKGLVEKPESLLL